MHQVAKVYLYDEYVGLLEEQDGPLYRFTYATEYLEKPHPKALSLSLPIQVRPFEQSTMFAFFAGLLSEGWLKRIQSQTQKTDDKNLMNRLLINGQELLGAVRIEESKT